MRFSQLSLERYGRFEDCELNFRSGNPDLHIIYGANEAGKTTSLSAVSDLLFGFPMRSSYNFLFDYALLRVGAVLEDNGRILACRRKKGTSGTLLDGSEANIDDAPLRGMLKGQTRETFGLSFSLDQEALRSGGKAMVEARNDLGRTLFAAGSGLIGIADELKGLESEADGIWGSTAKASRTFAKAQRQYSEASKAVRDEALKPRTWLDAKAVAESTRDALTAARKDRDAAQADLRAAERVRRLAPLARRRDEQIEALKAHEGTVDLGRQREDAAEKLIQEADEAVRQRSAAEQLRTELVDRRSKVAADPVVLAHSDEIERLAADSGAEMKAARDLVGLQAEQLAAAALVARLRKEAASNADTAPARAVATRLRELARIHGELLVSGREIAQSREDIEERRTRAKAKLAGEAIEEASVALIDAVDAARALGADADARCEATKQKADSTADSVPIGIARLAPWTGEVTSLLKLSFIGASEVDSARNAFAEIAAEVRREEEQERRSSDQADGVALEIAQVATGTAVSPEEIVGARQVRDDRWQPLRCHVLTGAPVDSPEIAVAEFEASVVAADECMDLRFALADASSKLSLLEQAKATHELEKVQAKTRAEDARRRQTEVLDAWIARVAEGGLPALEPTRFQTWQADRVRVEKANEELTELRTEANRADRRRDATRAALCAALSIPDPGGALAPVLATAERRRAKLEEALQQRRVAQSELDQVEADAATLDRRQQRLNPEIATNANAWAQAVTEAGLELDVLTCGAVLDLLDELREAEVSEAQLRRRIDGIARDALEHSSRVEQLADGTGIEPGDTAARLRTLRERHMAARSAATLLKSLDEEDRRREREYDEAQAKLQAAEEALASLLPETQTGNRVELAAAIERSRSKRGVEEEIASIERQILGDGDGLPLSELMAAIAATDPEQTAARVSALNTRLQELNHEADDAAAAHGDARSFFAAVDTESTPAVDAAADAEQARAELEVLAEHYILKRAQAVTLKWAIEKYRERHQDPLLVRAGELFSTLTIGRFVTLRVDTDGPSPRLRGLRDDGRTMLDVEAMSEGTTDQLFLALRLAALERSVVAGVKLPFLADDLFVNFDDNRAEAGFRVLAEVAKSTQVLFFTHHSHLMAIAKSVVGADLHSECALR